jgi:biotin carboxyl carrier protein
MEGKQDKITYSTFVLDDVKYKTTIPDKFANRKPYVPANPKLITAFIPGTIKKVNTAAKKKVKKGDILCILEAMKMLNQLVAPVNGEVKKIFVKEGDLVTKNQVLIEIV